MSIALLALPLMAGANILFTESFESPDITGQPSDDPDGWTTTGHPNYQSPVDVDNGDFTTPYGSQALSCYTSTGSNNWAYSLTTAAVLTNGLTADTRYMLSFNVAAVSGRPRAACRAELVAIDDGTSAITVLASVVSNSNSSSDMSYSNTLVFTSDSSHAALGGSTNRRSARNGLRLQPAWGGLSGQTPFRQRGTRRRAYHGTVSRGRGRRTGR